MTAEGNAIFVIRQGYTAMGQLQFRIVGRGQMAMLVLPRNILGERQQIQSRCTAGTRLGHRGFINNGTTGVCTEHPAHGP
jgi:hypothetical protein